MEQEKPTGGVSLKSFGSHFPRSEPGVSERGNPMEKNSETEL